MIIACKINVSVIDKARLFKGQRGTYLDILIMENKGGTDQYGNDYMIVQSVTKEEREKGIKGAILGNGKIIGQSKPASRPEPAAPRPTAEPGATPLDESDDQIPF